MQTQVNNAERASIMARIDLALRDECRAPKPRPNVSEYLAELWNAADYAVTRADLESVWRDFQELEAGQ